MKKVVLLIGVSAIAGLHASDDFDRPPIEYGTSQADNAISRLQDQLDKNEASIPYDPKHGYLPALLDALGIPRESQVLVFSKTSLQVRRIAPRTPRAIYFNDLAYVGYCQSGDLLEIAIADPRLGTVFYSLDQDSDSRPRFVRQTDNCLVCHSSSRTDGVPGCLVRSVTADPSGQPIFSAGSKTVDYQTPLRDRWGGWYVTGTHGSQTHLGNRIVREETVDAPVAPHDMNLEELKGRFDVASYLTPHSDIVALMVLEHQIAMLNKITKANFTTRQALAYEEEITKAMGDPPGTKLESTTRRIESAGNELIATLLFSGEAPLTHPIAGTAKFREWTESQGPRDSQGRSLRDLDLTHRLYKYPCSPLIHSPIFDALPEAMRNYVWKKLWEILVEEKSMKGFEHLSAEDRSAIASILRETKPHLPSPWQP